MIFSRFEPDAWSFPLKCCSSSMSISNDSGGWRFLRDFILQRADRLAWSEHNLQKFIYVLIDYHHQNVLRYLPISTFSFKDIISASSSITEYKSARSVGSISIFSNMVQTIRVTLNTWLCTYVKIIVTHRPTAWSNKRGRWLLVRDHFSWTVHIQLPLA